MEKNDIEKYRRELLELYGRSSQPDSAVPESTVPEDSAPNDTAYEEAQPGEDYSSRYPEPDLSQLDTDTGALSDEDSTPPEYSSDEALGAASGYIRVYVRTGDESAPVAGAAVSVTAVVDGMRVIIASGVTDGSGTAPTFTVPAPDLVHSQAPDPALRPYSLYDVSVTAEGFFNARSVDVPVFPGITSVQNFSMIPLPLMMRPSDETVTYYNQEPRF
ncbi:MAG: carboxypeptidase regulatory-like domain-containing protein [Ruminococcus sp.]|nr:carboxypeptidase regulatory-like domain-containing protein [Ruminococcus sp.]